MILTWLIFMTGLQEDVILDNYSALVSMDKLTDQQSTDILMPHEMVQRV